jgi:hypothetical protein
VLVGRTVCFGVAGPHARVRKTPLMAPERVISIAISEADWKTLRSIQPEPLDWLKGKIRETVEQARQTGAQVAPVAEKAHGAHH